MNLLDLTENPRDLGLLSLGLRLMSTPGKFGTALGQAGMGALQDVQQAQQAMDARKMRGLQQQMLEQQLAAAKAQQEEQARQREAESRFRASIPSPQSQALLALGGDASPTVTNAARMPKVDPQQDFLFNAMQAGQIKPMEYFQATKPQAPEHMVVGNSLVQIEGGNVKEAYRAPVKPDPMPASIREYQFAQDQGYQGTFQQFQLEQKKAGATNVNVPVNLAKPLLTTMAEGLGKQINDSLPAARAAVDTVSGARKIRAMLDSGQVVTGPGADWRILARQVGETLGVTGKDNGEVLTNTRRTIQQLAQFELEAAQGMKGQGQITESEREILRRAAAGSISFTAPELRALSQTLEDRALKRIRLHNEDVSRLGQMPQGDSLVPFYRVSEPATNSVDDLVNKYRGR